MERRRLDRLWNRWRSCWIKGDLPECVKETLYRAILQDRVYRRFMPV